MVQTDLSVFFRSNRRNRASVTPEKRIPGKKRNIRSLATSPPRKDTIPNQDKNTSGIEKYQSLPSHVPKFPTGSKSLRNEANNDHPESTDTSCKDRYDTSCTNQDDSIENMKATKNKNDDEKYKEDNLQHPHNTETVINKTK